MTFSRSYLIPAMPKDLDKTAKDVTRSPRGFNEEIWEGEGGKLRSKARKALLELAQAFWREVEHGAARVKDVTFSGSLAGDRWTQDSDVDLHLVVERGDDLDDEKMAEEYFRARSRMWNSKHSLELAGHPIELYIQDSEAPHHSAKIYSVLKDKWVKRDEQGEYPTADEVKRKAKPIASDVLGLVKRLDEEPTEELLDKADKMSERLRKLRQAGLESEGESSLENLAYKALKRAGYMEKLSDSRSKAFDLMVQSKLDDV